MTSPMAFFFSSKNNLPQRWAERMNKRKLGEGPYTGLSGFQLLCLAGYLAALI